MKPGARFGPSPRTLRIPTLPASIAKVEAILGSEDAGVADVADILEQDPPLCAKALRIANSVKYGRFEKTLSVRVAAATLGMHTLSHMVMTAGVISTFDHLRDVAGFEIERFWKHAILTAHISRDLGRRLPRPFTELSPEDCYTCGLLHDIGQIIMLDNYGERYVRMLRDVTDPRALHHAEALHFLGQTHAEVGGACAASWSLPSPISTIIRFHHRPSKAPAAEQELIQLIVFADELAELVAAADPFDAMSGSDALPHVPDGLSRETLTGVLRSARQCWDTIEV